MFDHSVTSNKLVSIEPRFLSRKVIEHILTELKTTLVGKCTKEHGFVKNIEIKKVLPAEISMADGGTRFSTTYTIQSILPKPGNVYQSQNIIIINHNSVCGVIATIDDSCEAQPFQIFIINCINKGDKYLFNDCKCVLPVSAKPTPFVLSDIVVDTVQYHEKRFVVIGKHIHDYCAPKNDKEVCANNGSK